MIIDGKKLAQNFENKLTKEVALFQSSPCLAIILVGQNPASQIYVKNKENTAAKIGINCQIINLPETVTEEELTQKINQLNQDKNINGTIVQLPLPKHLDEEKILNSISSSKDVDGFNPSSKFTPATALGVIEMLKNCIHDFCGLNAVVIGRSKIVGKPVAKLLLEKNCTVTICHSKTKDISYFTKTADIIVAACGQAKLLTQPMVNSNTTIIDVGINKLDNKLCGDCDFDNLKDYVENISPVPGGVGPMTVIMLMSNTITAYKEQKNV